MARIQKRPFGASKRRKIDHGHLQKTGKPSSGEQKQFNYSNGYDDVEEDLDSDADSSHALTADDIDSEDESMQSEPEEQAGVNPLQVQVSSILSSIRLPGIRSDSARPVHSNIDHCIKAFSNEKECTDIPLSKASTMLRSADKQIPFPIALHDIGSIQWKLSFKHPINTYLAGAWAMGYECKSKNDRCHIELAVEMPTTIFQENDIKDFRYFHKRAFYLAKLRSALVEEPFETEYVSFRGDYRLPVLHLTPKEETPKFKYTIVINPCLSISTLPFPINKLSPSRNNVRPSHVNKKVSDLTDSIQSSCSYNCSILASASRSTEMSLIKRAMKASPHFLDAAIMLRNWINKKGEYFWDNVQDWLVLYLAHLLSPTPPSFKNSSEIGLPRGAHSIGLFKGVLDHLARKNWNKPTYMTAVDNIAKHDFLEEHFKLHGKAVFVESTGSMNLLGDVSLASLQALSYQASVSLMYLDDTGPSPRVDVALNPPKIDPYLFFDNLFKFQVDWKSTPNVHKTNVPDVILAEYPSIMQMYQSYLGEDLQQALTDRIHAVYVNVEPKEKSHLDISRMEENKLIVTIGVSFNASNHSRIVDHGPSAEDKELCEAFKSFWGPKSELRRFKDSSIQEAIVWSASAPPDRATIVGQIVQHVLNHRFGIYQDHLYSFVTPFDTLIEVPARARHTLYKTDPRQKGFGDIRAAFDELVKTCRGLDDLPLAINHMAGISESLRYSSVFVPGPRRLENFYSSVPECAWYIDTHDILITFESSHQWPQDLEAVQKIKMAFLARLGELYTESVAGSQARISMKDEALPFEDNVSLELLTPSGYAFRLRVRHQPERSLLQLQTFERSDLKMATLKAVATFEKLCEALPRHHDAISSIQHAYPSYSPAVRLLKRFLSAHGLSSLHIPPEAIELIMASIYLPSLRSTNAYPAPSNGATAFLRALELLANFKWRESFLYVPLYESVGATDRMRISVEKEEACKSAFDYRRKMDPAVNLGAWSIYTDEDNEGTRWTREKPVRLIAQRVKDLAKAALKTISREDISFNEIFTPSLSAYEFVAHVNGKLSSRTFERTFKSSKHTEPSQAITHSIVPLSYDPVLRYVNFMQRCLGDSVVLFYDEFGGKYVGGISNPKLWNRAWNFKKNLGFISGPAETDESDANYDRAFKKIKGVKLNRDAVVWELQRLSNELITNVEKKWEQ